MTKSHTANRLGIDNTPDLLAIDNLKSLCKNVLEPVRLHYNIPIIPSSGFRCLELNRAIGSKDTSQHILGEAVDFEVAGRTNLEVYNWIRENLDFDQLILEFYTPTVVDSGWVHCSYKTPSSRNRKDSFIYG